MKKEFDIWNEKKKAVEGRERNITFKEGGIWWMYVGVNVGLESCGKGGDFLRPVLVLKKLSKSFFVGIPTSTVVKTNKHGWFFNLQVKGEMISFLLLQI